MTSKMIVMTYTKHGCHIWVNHTGTFCHSPNSYIHPSNLHKPVNHTSQMIIEKLSSKFLWGKKTSYTFAIVNKKCNASSMKLWKDVGIRMSELKKMKQEFLLRCGPDAPAF